MRYRIKFQLLRENPIANGYSPTWIWACQPEPNSARMLDIEDDLATLDPLFPDFWLQLHKGDNVDAYEGGTQTVHGIIVEVIEDGNIPKV